MVIVANYAQSLRLDWSIRDQNENFGMRSSRENHLQGVLSQYFHCRLSISSFTGWEHLLTIEKYLITPDFVCTSPVAICDC